jgi:hypothetical protein
MRLGDIYISKNKTNLIQIDSFAIHMNRYSDNGMIIIFRNLERHNEFEIGSCPSENGYGTTKEIEAEYDLFIHAENLNKYKDWNEIFKKADLKEANMNSEEYQKF